ncbi:MAG: acid phosphatase type 7, partial [Verrucomicrobiota bacterium]
MNHSLKSSRPGCAIAIISFLLVLRPAAGDAATLQRGPYLQAGTASSMILRWRTDQPGDSRVRIGATASNLIAEIINPNVTTEHLV